MFPARGTEMSRSAVHTSMKPGPYNKHTQTNTSPSSNKSSPVYARLYPSPGSLDICARGDTVTMFLRGQSLRQVLALKDALEPAAALPLLPGNWNF